MLDINALLEIVSREAHLRLDADIDDIMWNDTSFQFVLLFYDGSTSDHLRFCYDEDEELFGTAENQLMDWINWNF